MEQGELAQSVFDRKRLEDQCISCLKVGKIIVPERQATYRCTVRSMCWFGARIEINHYVDLPERFLLTLSDVDYSAPIRCKIASREGLKIFVDFDDV